MGPGPSTSKRPRRASKPYQKEYLTESSEYDPQDEEIPHISGHESSSCEDKSIEPPSSTTPAVYALSGTCTMSTTPRSRRYKSAVQQNITATAFPFNKGDELLVSVPGNTPMVFVNLLVSDQFFELVVAETNTYAQRSLEKRKSLLMHIGTISLNRMQDYWKTDHLFKISCFSDQMSHDRFLPIFRCLHFARNPTEDEPRPDDRLYKIRSLIDYFNNTMLRIYYPGKNLSLDESMVLWRGRLLSANTSKIEDISME
ncbi:hypothetical protein NQ314_000552 [Rhamnusium bicolor]|uniref:PiggyBac transposable element-derived protein domain-containing protein n=1 Tax=Rhamnusium bicolor TaxID=1586634 RepID=A0AAV8ZXU4_9CUCU|nr:hypothetical protein NQ314_000552 [Rhamnusium bicolor]